MVAEFLTTTILSGFMYDEIKKGIIITADFLKIKLKEWLLEGSDYEIISNIANNAPENNKKTQKYFEAYLDDNEDIKKIIEKTKSNPNIQYNQENSGGNNIQGNRNTQNITTINYQGGSNEPKKS